MKGMVAKMDVVFLEVRRNERMEEEGWKMEGENEGRAVTERRGNESLCYFLLSEFMIGW